MTGRRAFRAYAFRAWATVAVTLAVSASTMPPSAQAQTVPVATPPPRSVARSAGRNVRFVTWNVSANSIAIPAGARIDFTRASRPAAFARVMRALDPDVVCLQELTIGAARAAALFDDIRPLERGQRWHAYAVLGNVLLSRWPLVDRQGETFRQGLSQRGHAIAVVDLPDTLASRDPVVACTHLQAKGGGANLAFRERQARAIVATLHARALRDGIHDAARPIVVLGDFNAIDRPAPYLATLRQGDGGASFPLADAHPPHNALGPELWTWRDDRQPFAPGVLDYILFSERLFVVRNAFVLNTMTLDSTALLGFRLRRGDSMRDPAAGVHDHLPVGVDLEVAARGAAR